MTASLDDYRAVMAALDRIEASPIASGPLSSGGGELRLWAQGTRALVERMRDRAEDLLFQEHGRLGFESERRETEAEDSPAEDRGPKDHEEDRGPALRREAILSSREPTSALAARLGVSQAYVAKTRREAGERCAFYSGSALTAEHRSEIAWSAEPTRVLAARHGVSEALVNKIRKSGPQGEICAPAKTGDGL